MRMFRAIIQRSRCQTIQLKAHPALPHLQHKVEEQVLHPPPVPYSEEGFAKQDRAHLDLSGRHLNCSLDCVWEIARENSFEAILGCDMPFTLLTLWNGPSLGG